MSCKSAVTYLIKSYTIKACVYVFFEGRQTGKRRPALRTGQVLSHRRTVVPERKSIALISVPVETSHYMRAAINLMYVYVVLW